MKTSDEKNESKKRPARRISVYAITLTALMCAVTCVLGPLSIPLPFSPVPISLTNLAIYFTVYVIGMKKGTASYLLYLLIGLVGVPVFSAFTAGPGKLFGPTGGYLIGFIFLAVISGFFVDRWPKRRLMQLLGMVLGTALCYLIGTLWLSFESHISFAAALVAGVIPFLPGDAVKILLALWLGPEIRKRLKSAGLI